MHYDQTRPQCPNRVQVGFTHMYPTRIRGVDRFIASSMAVTVKAPHVWLICVLNLLEVLNNLRRHYIRLLQSIP